MSIRKLLTSLVAAALAAIMAGATTASAAPKANQDRVRDAFTAWDNQYFYAGFQVNDLNVISKNDSPISQPQQDDDIEVFLETDGVGKSAIRTDKTYQMAVSAAGGAYISVGDGTPIPHPMTVLTYKFAANVEGTLNDPGDLDTGYTIELAIPWDVLGLSAPPQPGTVFGFNVLSRNRDSLAQPATTAYSLSQLVQSAADIQNPTKWTQIEFTSDVTAAKSTSGHIYCARVSDPRYAPVIDGVLSSGEWPVATGFTFGDKAFEAPAPTADQEPNIKSMSLDLTPIPPTPQPAPATTPSAPATPAQPPAQSATVPTNANGEPDFNIYLPGGTTVHVGKAPPHVDHPFVVEPLQPDHIVKPKPVIVSTPDKPLVSGQDKPAGAPDIDFSGVPPLPVQTHVPQLVLADYYLSSISYLQQATLDQPADPGVAQLGIINIARELNTARNSGIDALLVHYSGSNPDDVAALPKLVAALELLRQNKGQYPLVALRNDGVSADIVAFFAVVPPQFRAQTILPDSVGNARAYIAVVNDNMLSVDLEVAFRKAFGSRAGLFLTSMAGSDTCKIVTVSPGGNDGAGHIVARLHADAYQNAWKGAAGADWVIVNSLNDFRSGTEILSSRQYGEQYLDLTRGFALAFHGAQPWSATFQQNDCPSIVSSGGLYAVKLRVENTGTLPWRIGDNYALAYRWYRDGALYDDSAPRINLPTVLPGEAVDLGVGVAAINSYGTKLEPGDYTLVFDIVQGNTRWFSFTGGIPLKVAVHIPDDNENIPSSAWVSDTMAPPVISAGQSYPVTVTVRNDAGAMWKAGSVTATYSLASADGDAVDAQMRTPAPLLQDTSPGALATFGLTLTVPPSAAQWQAGRLTILLSAPDPKSIYSATIPLGPDIRAGAFNLSDVPRHLKTGESATGQIALINSSTETWVKKSVVVTADWEALDGTELGLPDNTTTIADDMLPGDNIVVHATYQAPPFAGRYLVIFTAKRQTGAHGSAKSTQVLATLPLQVWVTPNSAADTIPLDLSSQFDSRGVAFDGESGAPGIDGAGGAIPGEMLPPDDTHEVNGNPFVIGRPGPAYYPSGFYVAPMASAGEPVKAHTRDSHIVSYLYPVKNGNDMISCKGQTISVPDGAYKAVHILAAAGSTSSVSADFTLLGSGGKRILSLTVQSWNQRPISLAVHTAFETGYSLQNGAVNSTNPSVLGDYTLIADPANRLTQIVLPNNPLVKVFGITLER